MYSYRIVLHYTANTPSHSHPETWDWWGLLNVEPDEVLSVELVEDIATPEEHKEELQQVS